MGLQLPSELTEPLSWIGLDWPQADEELLFAAGQQWLDFGLRLQAAAEGSNDAAAQVWSQNEGEAVDAFRRWWQDDEGPQRRLLEDSIAAQIIGTALIIFAAITLYLKIAFIIQLIVLLVQVTMAIAAAVPTLGASTAAVPGFIAVTRIVCQRLIKQVVNQVQTLLKQILMKAKALLKLVRTRGGRPDADRLPGDPLTTPPGNVPRPLTDTDRAALHDYTTNDGYRTMNPFLRDPSQYSDAERAAIQARADRVSEGLAKLPAEPGVTYRGVDFPSDVLDRYSPGEVVTERAFTSTTRDPNVAQGAFDGNVLMTVTGRNGRDVAPFSEYSHEAEILYDQGTNFKVTGKVWEPDIGKWVITMEEM